MVTVTNLSDATCIYKYGIMVTVTKNTTVSRIPKPVRLMRQV
jgi:hypothetical protein